MKRILSLILCAVLLCGLLGVGAYAESSATLVITSDVAEAAAGDDIAVTFSLQNNPGLTGFKFVVDYDKSVLTYDGYSQLIKDKRGNVIGKYSMDSFEEDSIAFWYNDDAAYTGNDLFTLYFIVADGVPSGEITITMVEDDYVEFDDADINKIDVAVSPCTIQINGTEPQTLEDGFYLIGINGWTVNDINPEHKFEQYDVSKPYEYKLVTTLAVGNQIKVVKVAGGAIAAWYPDQGGNYTVNEAHSGSVNIYFQEEYQNGWSEFGGYFYIAARHTVTVDANIENGTVTVDKATAAPQEDVTVTVTPAAGYALETLYYEYQDNDTTRQVTINAGDDGKYTFAMPAADVTIYATFKLVTYKITATAQPTEGGTVSVEPTEAAPGATIRVFVEANAGYELTSLTRITGDSDHVENIEKDEHGDYTFVMPEGDVAVTATFTALPLNITVDSAITNGTVTAPETATVGETVTVTVAPAEGYELERLYYKIKDNANEIDILKTNDAYTFEMPSNDVTIYATFKAALVDGFYLAGVKGWEPADLIGYKFVENPEKPGEYMLETFLPEGKGIKAVKVVNGAIAAYYPDQGDNYTVDAAHAGQVTVYFSETYKSDWANPFGGHIYIDEALHPQAEIYGSSLSLKGNIGLNFYLILPEDVVADEGAYVSITVKAEGGDVELDPMYVKSAKTRTVGDVTLYQFSVSLHAKQMNDVVSVKLCNASGPITLIRHSNGEEIDGNYEYSVQDYISLAPDALSNNKLNGLMDAMSDYGALAQLHFGYRTDKVADIRQATELAAVEADTLKTFDATVTEGTATGVTYYGVSLVLESETAIRVYFTVDDVAACTFKQGSKDLTPVANGSTYYVEIPNISAKNLDTFYTVTVTKDGETALTVKVCALSYCYKVLNGDAIRGNNTLEELVKGIYLYNEAANTYFNS